MDILVSTHFLNGLLMILIPIGLGIFLTHHFKLGWRLWWIGGVTFILSQLGHIPFNIALTALFKGGNLPVLPEDFTLVFNAIILGLSAAIWGAYGAEMLVGLMATVCLASIFLFQPKPAEDSHLKDKPGKTVAPTLSTRDINIPEIEETEENLDASRYT
jgi:hypothetical protein